MSLSSVPDLRLLVVLLLVVGIVIIAAGLVVVVVIAVVGLLVRIWILVAAIVVICWLNYGLWCGIVVVLLNLGSDSLLYLCDLSHSRRINFWFFDRLFID